MSKAQSVAKALASYLRLSPAVQPGVLAIMESDLFKEPHEIVENVAEATININGICIPKHVLHERDTAGVVEYYRIASTIKVDPPADETFAANTFGRHAAHDESSQNDHYGTSEHAWIQTYRGGCFSYLNIQPDDLDIDDIAHALSLVNRFTGHTKVAYSVAEHSVRAMWCVSNLCADEIEQEKIPLGKKMAAAKQWRYLVMFEALMHDASEAYVADLARPVKMMPQLNGYREVEKIVEKAIRSKWKLPETMSPIVKRADVIMLSTEARDLMAPLRSGWKFREKPLPATIRPWTADLAEYRFKAEYCNLLEKLGIEG